MDGTCTLFTIGHSNHATETFIATLARYKIARLVDVRSQPYSQWARQFNRKALKRDLEEAGIDYVYLGDVLGGRPADGDYYTPGHERPNYERMANAPTYQAGIQTLLALTQERPLAVMCSEGDHRRCHRQLLITQTLVRLGISVEHIQPDGTCTPGLLEPEQLTLFGQNA